MRLWHYDLITYLPKSQLLGQWRELNSIYKKRDKHILINYIYDYDRIDLLAYSFAVIEEMERRGYRVNKENMRYYFGGDEIDKYKDKTMILSPHPFYKHHNGEYLTICYWNLREKFIRGQNDFTPETWEKIDRFYYKNRR